MVRYAAAMSHGRSWILLFTLFLILIVSTAPAAAQPEEPIPYYVIDARGSLAFYGQNAEIASTLGVVSTTMPSRAIGFEVGAHVYPLRYRAITFGIGASFHASGAEKTPALPEGQTMQTMPSVRTAFRAFNPQLSFNFGKREGWSYISGGMGTTTLDIQKILPDMEARADAGRRSKTINYGGGARWFTSDHIAFTVDVRFYAISPLAGTDTDPARPRLTLVVINVGAAFK